MNTSTVETIAVALAVIAVVTYRQTRWQPVNMSRLLRMPAIFAVVGVVLLSASIQQLPHGWHLGVLDIVVLVGELGAGLVAGVMMGRLTLLSSENGVLQCRLSGPALGIWLGFIVLRIGFGILAAAVGATFAAQPGAVIIVIAVIKTVQAFVVRERISRHRSDEYRRTYAVSGF